MSYLLIFDVALRIIAIATALILNMLGIPVFVTILTGCSVLAGIFLIVKKYTKGIRTNELAMYWVLRTAVILINLLVVTFGTPVNVSFVETIICGTLLDVLIYVVLIILAVKKQNYVNITSDEEQKRGN